MSRRSFAKVPFGLPFIQLGRGTARSTAAPIKFSASLRTGAPQFDPADVSTVGVYDGDWLETPPFERMLDLMMSSPGTISGVRFFGLLTSGTPEMLEPETGGVVWTDAAEPPDFTLPFSILESLKTRGLTPFIALGFFPPAISANPISPPASFVKWQELIATFLKELATDERFGADLIRTWRFEVWNEPNEGRFWTGTFQQYLDLYRATSEAVRATGLPIALGGPAMAYKPESEREDGPETMRRFLTFLRDEPGVQCEFISYHRKGTVDRSAPDPGRLWQAGEEVEALVREIVPERLGSLEVINNEADEKIGFESPYAPRMDAFAASWLSTLVSISAGKRQQTGRDNALPHRFYPDNANLQLIESPFDGRRSLYVPATNDDQTRLFKTSGAVWYDLLPLLSGTFMQSASDDTVVFPLSDLHVISTRTEASLSVLATWFPIGDEEPGGDRVERIEIDDIPWHIVNVYEYRIDEIYSNAYRAAGGGRERQAPQPSFDQFAAIRLAQELTYRRSVEGPTDVQNRTLILDLELGPFTTCCFWITPYDPSPIDPPTNARIDWHDAEVDIVWEPVQHPQLLGYEVERFTPEVGSATSMTLRPIRPTLVTDSRPAGKATYRVRAVSASGAVSDWTSISTASSP